MIRTRNMNKLFTADKTKGFSKKELKMINKIDKEDNKALSELKNL